MGAEGVQEGHLVAGLAKTVAPWLLALVGTVSGMSRARETSSS